MVLVGWFSCTHCGRSAVWMEYGIEVRFCYYKLQAEDGSTSPYLAQPLTPRMHSLTATTDGGAAMAEVHTTRDCCYCRKSRKGIDWGGGNEWEHGGSYGRCLHGCLHRKQQRRRPHYLKVVKGERKMGGVELGVGQGEESHHQLSNLIPTI